MSNCGRILGAEYTCLCFDVPEIAPFLSRSVLQKEQEGQSETKANVGVATSEIDDIKHNIVTNEKEHIETCCGHVSDFFNTDFASLRERVWNNIPEIDWKPADEYVNITAYVARRHDTKDGCNQSSSSNAQCIQRVEEKRVKKDSEESSASEETAGAGSGHSQSRKAKKQKRKKRLDKRAQFSPKKSSSRAGTPSVGKDTQICTQDETVDTCDQKNSGETSKLVTSRGSLDKTESHVTCPQVKPPLVVQLAEKAEENTVSFKKRKKRQDQSHIRRKSACDDQSSGEEQNSSGQKKQRRVSEGRFSPKRSKTHRVGSSERSLSSTLRKETEEERKKRRHSFSGRSDHRDKEQHRRNTSPFSTARRRSWEEQGELAGRDSRMRNEETRHSTGEKRRRSQSGKLRSEDDKEHTPKKKKRVDSYSAKRESPRRERDKRAGSHTGRMWKKKQDKKAKKQERREKAAEAKKKISLSRPDANISFEQQASLKHEHSADETQPGISTKTHAEKAGFSGGVSEANATGTWLVTRLDEHCEAASAAANETQIDLKSTGHRWAASLKKKKDAKSERKENFTEQASLEGLPVDHEDGSEKLKEGNTLEPLAAVSADPHGEASAERTEFTEYSSDVGDKPRVDAVEQSRIALENTAEQDEKDSTVGTAQEIFHEKHSEPKSTAQVQDPDEKRSRKTGEAGTKEAVKEETDEIGQDIFLDEECTSETQTDKGKSISKQLQLEEIPLPTEECGDTKPSKAASSYCSHEPSDRRASHSHSEQYRREKHKHNLKKYVDKMDKESDRSSGSLSESGESKQSCSHRGEQERKATARRHQDDQDGGGSGAELRRTERSRRSAPRVQGAGWDAPRGGGSRWDRRREGGSSSSDWRRDREPPRDEPGWRSEGRSDRKKHFDRSRWKEEEKNTRKECKSSDRDLPTKRGSPSHQGEFRTPISSNRPFSAGSAPRGKVDFSAGNFPREFQSERSWWTSPRKRCVICKTAEHNTNEAGCPAYDPEPQNYVCFKGAECTMSNFFLCHLRYEDRNFRSTEHAYQWQKARDIGEDAAAEQIVAAPDGKSAKRVSNRLDAEAAGRWKVEKSIGVMKKLIAAKYDQVEEFRRACVESGEAYIMEATFDKFWGVGLLEDFAMHCKLEHIPGKNVLGWIIMQVRNEHSAHLKGALEALRNEKDDDAKPVFFQGLDHVFGAPVEFEPRPPHGFRRNYGSGTPSSISFSPKDPSPAAPHEKFWGQSPALRGSASGPRGNARQASAPSRRSDSSGPSDHAAGEQDEGESTEGTRGWTLPTAAVSTSSQEGGTSTLVQTAVHVPNFEIPRETFKAVAMHSEVSLHEEFDTSTSLTVASRSEEVLSACELRSTDTVLEPELETLVLERNDCEGNARETATDAQEDISAANPSAKEVEGSNNSNQDSDNSNDSFLSCCSDSSPEIAEKVVGAVPSEGESRGECEHGEQQREAVRSVPSNTQEYRSQTLPPVVIPDHKNSP